MAPSACLYHRKVCIPINNTVFIICFPFSKLKLIQLFPIKLDGNSSPELIFFTCSICCMEGKDTYLFDNIDDTYQHWRKKHSMEHRTFNFSIDKFAKCFHCEFYSTFEGLRDHHHKKHPSTSFVIVDWNNGQLCGLCNYNGNEMDSHFERDHKIIINANVINPIPISGNVLNVIEPLHMHINRNQSVRCRCNHCKEIILADDYFSHIMNAHEYNFDCAKCGKTSTDLIGVSIHEKQNHRSFALNYFLLEFVNVLRQQYYRSEIILANGFIINKHSLISTKYGDIHTFDQFIAQLIDHLIGKYKKWTRKMSMEKLLCLERNRNSTILTIRGMPSTVDRDLKEVFIHLCALVDVVIMRREIRKIRRIGHVISVNVSSTAMKKTILKRAFGKRILLGDLIEVPSDQQHSQIFIFN